jgi:hypothetical protein
MEDDTSGFYKLEDESLLYGTVVCGPTYTLISEDHESYTYPVDGWRWFETEAEARAFYDLPPE